MPAREILLLGDPLLRKACRPIRAIHNAATQQIITDLRDTLEDFRTRRGFGRGIAAPQIGCSLRVLYIRTPEYTGAMIDPAITRRSRARFELWDDCFSFPDLLVRVRRHQRIDVAFRDGSGTRRTIRAEGSLSELLQHEIDHLDGILAIDRAIDSRHIILRSAYERLQRLSPTAL